MKGKKFLATCLTATALSNIGNSVYASQKDAFLDNALKSGNNFTCEFSYKTFSIFSGFTKYNTETNIDLKSKNMLVTVTNSETGEIVRKMNMEIITWRLDGSSEVKLQVRTVHSEYPIVDAAYLDTDTLEMSFNLKIAKNKDPYQGEWLEGITCENDK